MFDETFDLLVMAGIYKPATPDSTLYACRVEFNRSRKAYFVPALLVALFGSCRGIPGELSRRFLSCNLLLIFEDFFPMYYTQATISTGWFLHSRRLRYPQCWQKAKQCREMFVNLQEWKKRLCLYASVSPLQELIGYRNFTDYQEIWPKYSQDTL